MATKNMTLVWLDYVPINCWKADIQSRSNNSSKTFAFATDTSKYNISYALIAKKSSASTTTNRVSIHKLFSHLFSLGPFIVLLIYEKVFFMFSPHIFHPFSKFPTQKTNDIYN